MAACCTHCLLLHFLVGFTPYSDAVICQEGILLQFGNGFTKKPVKWKSFDTEKTGPEEMCQETLLIVDVGPMSLILGSKGPSNPGDSMNEITTEYASGPGIVAASYFKLCDTDLCNHADSSQVLLKHLLPSNSTRPGTTQCPVCLHFQGSCTRNSNYVHCPKGTACYTGDITITGGGFSNTFSIDGCLHSSGKTLLKGKDTIGIFSVVEKLDMSLTANSFSHLFGPGTSLTWLLGLGLFLALCLSGFDLSAQPIPLWFLSPVGSHTQLSSDVIT
ncbi:CD177 antigen isoform X2 [Cricetulus griseus]|uniref:CD177 antigen isoform X2 n=2 Tax=Cricetulus griseus TaxID=10029 RepID=A0A9J7K1L5_CRIGR|nr:CD177 antigen isoform X2 [Cricetulus griseus]